MKFYLDFEATDQNYITSIGCACENGQTFRSLVKLPAGAYISPFVSELTGLTAALLEREGQPASVAFRALFEFIQQASTDGCRPEYFCYGNMDKGFLRKTAEEAEQDVLAWTVINSLANNIVDAAPLVQHYFSVSSSIGLMRVYNLLDETAVQRHDALEDALMLKEIMEQLEQLPVDAFAAFDQKNREKSARGQENESAQAPQRPKRRPVPEFFQHWSGSHRNKYTVDTFGTKEQYAIKACSEKHEKYFDSLETAVLWIMKYTTGAKPSSWQEFTRFEKRVTKAIEGGKPYFGMQWARNETAEDQTTA